MAVALDGSRAPSDEHARIFREAQRAADTIFSHYQLSQLLATHALPDSMSQAVLDELVHVCDAVGGALWLVRPGATAAALVATTGPVEPPAERPDPDRGLADGSWIAVELEDVGSVALAFDADRPIDVVARRFLTLVRHELAIALRGAMLRETLERERGELAAIIQGATDAVVVVDADRRVRRANPAAERMLRRVADHLEGMSCHEALGCELDGEPPLPCAGRCPLGRVLAGGDRVDGAERSIAGTTVVGSYAVAGRSPDGRPQAVAILRDTSELARLAELRRGFLASVSHELRTPIALIKGYVETLLDLRPDPATARTYLERIDATADRLGGLVAQIIDSTQLAADRLDLDLAPVELGSLVHQAVAELAVRAGDRRLRVELQPNMPAPMADRDRLRQVIDNLLSNAVKYGAAGDEISVSVRVEGGDAVIRIEDDGLGVPSDERDLVFEQFHRARNARERGVRGSGLGLAISRRLVEAHQGTISFDPDRSEGAAVVVRLPLAGRTGASA
ncbi:MAG TPA: HAMP domain-containing sensor histidine kinase [Candidatus Limnocylindrales bacterium]|nr:HAMP domain-containing sensor histidine kinase [Candidatus Limnocylindrales bacterium]